MNREEFLSQLQKKLKNLPQDEIDNAISYYSEYLEEVSPEDEESALEKLGSPSEVAADIKGEFAIKTVDEEKVKVKPDKKEKSTLGIVLLAIFASPIALPLAIAAVVLIIALVIVLFSVIIALGAAGLGLSLYGLILIVTSIILLFSEFTTAVFFFGIALFGLGAGTLLMIATWKTATKSYHGIIKLAAKLLKRGKRK